MSETLKLLEKPEGCSYLANLTKILTDKAPTHEFYSGCIMLGSRQFDHLIPNFIKYWKTQNIVPDAEKLRSLEGNRRALDIFRECVNICTWVKTLYEVLDLESYLDVIRDTEYFASHDRKWIDVSERFPMATMSLCDDFAIARINFPFDLKPEAKSIISGGRIIRTLLEEDFINEGDIDMYFMEADSSLKVTRPEKCRIEKFPITILGNCLTVECPHDNHLQYIKISYATPESIVEDFNMVHLEAWHDGKKLWMSDVALSCFKHKITLARNDGISFNRAKKTHEFGYRFLELPIIIRGAKIADLGDLQTLDPIEKIKPKLRATEQEIIEFCDIGYTTDEYNCSGLWPKTERTFGRFTVLEATIEYDENRNIFKVNDLGTCYDATRETHLNCTRSIIRKISAKKYKISGEILQRDNCLFALNIEKIHYEAEFNFEECEKMGLF